MVEVLTRYLRPLASKIDGTYDLFTGLDMAAVGKYNVVILDLRMQTTDKDDAMHAIRQFKSYNAAVVVVSGLPDDHIKEDVLAAGADAFVAKDSRFSSQAMMLATNIATLKLPKDSYKSDSYLDHVNLLHQMVTHL